MFKGCFIGLALALFFGVIVRAARRKQDRYAQIYPRF